MKQKLEVITTVPKSRVPQWWRDECRRLMKKFENDNGLTIENLLSDLESLTVKDGGKAKPIGDLFYFDMFQAHKMILVFKNDNDSLFAVLKFV